MTGDNDIVKEFLVESYENLDRLDRDLLELEKDPTAQEILASIFRTIHTIKGTCGFLGFSHLEKVAHVGENLLSRLREGLLQFDEEITTVLLRLVDSVRGMLLSIESTGNDGERNDDELLASLTRLLESRSANAAGNAPGPSRQAEASAESALRTSETSSPRVARLLETANPAEPSGEFVESPTGKRIPKPADPAEGLHAQGKQNVGDTTIRVDVSLLDQLMNLVGELVLARNQILQFTNAAKEAVLLATSQRLNLITTELQEGVMKTRMQPIGNVWSKFPRIVRDLALGCGKQVHIEMEGKETELDKTIIEAIKDPLTHLVRNAVDHGIESPEVRRQAGKNPEGSLLLRAFHEGGQVNIEISDDGAGLNLERIRNKAIQKGLITSDQAARMSDREIANLIFMAGLSTAEKITNVSGRGVGMDVVKTNIEKIGGTVDIQSKPGAGSTIRVKIPLTLAIIPALMVTSGSDRYAIPQVSLLELVGLEGEQARRGVELIQGAPVYRLRGRLLPLLYLNRELKVATSVNGDAENHSVNIVVLQADDRQFGLVVDAISDTEEIVVKPLSKQLKGIPVYAGATILGDGKVALILDVLGLAQSAHVVSESHDRAGAEADAATSATSDRNPMLLFQYGNSGRMAIDLGLVARLEEFRRDAVEHTGTQEVVQYRGQIMPLVQVSRVLGAHNVAASEPQMLQVIVYSDRGRSVGLVIDRILDIVDDVLEVQKDTSRPGVAGSAVIQQRITDILNLPELIAMSANRDDDNNTDTNVIGDESDPVADHEARAAAAQA